MRDAANMDTWTDARVDQLKALYAGGLSSSEIAGEIGGLTKNAVIGKVHRLGLRRTSRPKSGPKPDTQPAPRSIIAIGPTVSRQADGGLVEKVRFGVKARKALADKDRCTTQRIANAHLRKSNAKSKPKRTKAEPTSGGFLGITFMELEEGRCKFPRGENAGIRFCGQSCKDELPYCGPCMRIAYAPPPARRDNSPAPANYAAPGTAWG